MNTDTIRRRGGRGLGAGAGSSSTQGKAKTGATADSAPNSLTDEVIESAKLHDYADAGERIAYGQPVALYAESSGGARSPGERTV